MEKREKYIKLNPYEAKELIDREKDLIIIDARTESEYLYEGKLENSINLDFLKPRIFKREIQKFDKNKNYLVYCAVGRVSKSACELMSELENSINLDFLKPRIFKREIQKFDKNKNYLVYCAVGRVSKSACELMSDLGFEKVFELSGGLKAWQKEEDLVSTVSKLDDEEIIEARKKIITRLNKIEGQIRGMKKMLLDFRRA